MKKSLLMLLSFFTIFTIVSCTKNNNKIEMPQGNKEICLMVVMKGHLQVLLLNGLIVYQNKYK